MKKALVFIALIFSFQCFADLQSADIPYPFYKVISDGSNEVMNIHDGMAAMQLRLEMIRRARKNIEVEYFIFNTDLAGRILLRELVTAAQRGVKVRILVDKAPGVYKLKKYFREALAERGVEVRIYNTAPMVYLSTVQFRNHRKLLSVDDSEAITGGRNIGNDYFDMDERFNFYDRDIYVKGTMVKTLRESFDAYYDNPISKPHKRIDWDSIKSEKKRLKITRKLEAGREFLEETEEEIAAREKFATIGKDILNTIPSFQCPELTFSTDAPGAKFTKRMKKNFKDDFRHLRKTLHDKVSVIDRKLFISSPYMIHNRRTKRLMKHLLSRNVDVTIHTNSLASTDAIYVAANLYLTLMSWRRKGINIYLHDGTYHGENPLLDEEVKSATWGTHTKAMIYETSRYSEVMIGTYNMDNRSNFYNSEMALFCKGNDEFTKHVKEDLEGHAQRGYVVNKDGTASDRNGQSKSVHGSARGKLILMSVITLPSWLLNFLL